MAYNNDSGTNFQFPISQGHLFLSKSIPPHNAQAGLQIPVALTKLG